MTSISKIITIIFLSFMAHHVYVANAFVMTKKAPCTQRYTHHHPLQMGSSSQPPPSTENEKDESESSAAINDTPTPPEIPTISNAKVIASVVAFTLFWPLLALLRTTIGHGQIDVDMFMALQSILGESSPMKGDEIIELPTLSPAEQLVGAFFGPPSAQNSGFSW